MANAAAQKNTNERELSNEGCYGSIVKATVLDEMLLDFLAQNEEAYKIGEDRWCLCIWGHAGIGKTSAVNDFRKRRVMWCEKWYDGYDVRMVPVAQFEEMGDLHGMPSEHLLMILEKGKSRQEQWVSRLMVDEYRAAGWGINHTAGVRTMCSPPDWVPLHPGPSILCLDDFNRASPRILKGIMQLKQTYGMVSWKLPAGCSIILTANPHGQDYGVSNLDEAQLTRMKHVTLNFDAKDWAVWAERNKLDPRGISFVLYYPEILQTGGERTNPRTFAEFCRILRKYDSVEGNKDKILLHASSLLDDPVVSNFIVFATREMKMVVDPEDLLNGKVDKVKYLKSLLEEKDPRLDVFNVCMERLFARMADPACPMSEDRKKNFQDLMEADWMPADIRHSFCYRFMKACKSEGEGGDKGRARFWLLGRQKLSKLILDTLRT